MNISKSYVVNVYFDDSRRVCRFHRHVTFIPAAFPHPLSRASLGSRGPLPARTALPPTQRPPAHLFLNASASSVLTRCRCTLTRTTSPAGGLRTGFPLLLFRGCAQLHVGRGATGSRGVAGRGRGTPARASPARLPRGLVGGRQPACAPARVLLSRRCGSCAAQSSPLAFPSCARPAALNTRNPDVLVPLLPAPPGAYSRSSMRQGLRVLSRLLPPIQCLLLPFLPSLAFALTAPFAPSGEHQPGGRAPALSPQ